MRKLFLGALYCLLVATNATAQKNTHAIFWQVSGNNLAKPSYLFGTFHLLTNSFADTLKNVQLAFSSCSSVAGELIIDSSMQGPMAQAAIMSDNSLEKLLPDSIYSQLKQWLQDEAGIPLAQLHQVKPAAISSLMLALAQQKYLPAKAGETQLDSYFQQKAKAAGKTVVGLETLEDQLNLLFYKPTLIRQAELLAGIMAYRNRFKEMLLMMNNSYLQQDITALDSLMYDETYTREEVDDLLKNRNLKWVEKIPALMQKAPTFIAVGALHLAGDYGLVTLLQKKGYIVTPLNIKQ
jgi:uncharacterized protein YbaP (TraB family)